MNSIHMYKFLLLLFSAAGLGFPSPGNTGIQQFNKPTDTIPSIFIGNFTDDYGIRYNVTDSLFLQRPGIKYHIIRWNVKEQFIIARNDMDNPSEKGLYSRIDYMQFKNMEPFLWGFCLTVYNAANDSIAEFSVKADRINPKKGCNGYPFSRMKRTDP